MLDHAAAVEDLIESLRMHQVDVLGFHRRLARGRRACALARPQQVRRVVLIGLPATDGNYQAGERLPLLRQPVMVLRPRDDLWEATARAIGQLRDARRIDLPNAGAGMLEAAGGELVGYLREFLDR